MKRFIFAAILASTAFGSASAMTTADQLIDGNRVEIMRLVPGADLSNLSNVQVAAITILFSNSENLRSGNNPAGALKVILGWN